MTVLFTFTYDAEVSFKATTTSTHSDRNLREWMKAASEEELEKMIQWFEDMARQDPFDVNVTAACDRHVIEEMAPLMDDVKERLRLLRLRKSNRAAGGSSSKF